jgi:hypothetical protein
VSSRPTEADDGEAQKRGCHGALRKVSWITSLSLRFSNQTCVPRIQVLSTISSLLKLYKPGLCQKNLVLHFNLMRSLTMTTSSRNSTERGAHGAP